MVNLCRVYAKAPARRCSRPLNGRQAPPRRCVWVCRGPLVWHNCLKIQSQSVNRIGWGQKGHFAPGVLPVLLPPRQITRERRPRLAGPGPAQPQHPEACPPAGHGPFTPATYSAVAGSIIEVISEMRSTGKPPRLACSRIMSSLGARYTQ